MPAYDRCVHEFILDFRKPTINRIQTVNGDTANTFLITLKDKGKAVTLDADLHKIVAVFTRADGQIYTQDASTGVSFTTGGVVTIAVYSSSFRTGVNNVKIQLYKRESQSATEYPLLLTTYEQQFQGRSQAIPDSGAPNAPSQLPMLEQLISDANTAVTNANNAVTAANNAASNANDKATLANNAANNANAKAIIANDAATAAGIAASNANNASANAGLATTAANNAATAANAAAALAEQAARDIDQGYPVTIKFRVTEQGTIPVQYACDHTYAQMLEYYNQGRPMYAAIYSDENYKNVQVKAVGIVRKSGNSFIASFDHADSDLKYVYTKDIMVSDNNTIVSSSGVIPIVTHATVSNGVISFKDYYNGTIYTVTLPLYNGGVE